jgi:transcriptional regulator with PAS, ATPase and Fis domain
VLVSAPEDDDSLGSSVVTQLKRGDDPLFGEESRPGHLQMVVIGEGMFATHVLAEGASILIGRSSKCDITIDDDSISRRHAVLKTGDELTIEDLGSVNGTRVRGDLLEQASPATIRVGELFAIGSVSVLLQLRTQPMRPRRLWTHDYFEARLEEECARVQRTGAGFALLHVKPEGQVEEAVLEEVLAELIRESDVLGKYGPREYEILLPETPSDKAREAVQRIESKLRQRRIACRVGIVCCPVHGRTPYQLTARMQTEARNVGPTGGNDIVVADRQMQSLHDMVAQIAGSQIGVLLLGETGVGKEVFARAVHNASPRAKRPFVEINCAAVTETLLESELFGHEKGAFTHASAAKPGLIELADGGTLFLDEIGDMPATTQAKLLRVIEDAQLRRVGAVKSRAIDVRFVAATNADVEAQIARGAFRRDLYFRLNGVTIVIPPLRERVAEIEALANAFLRQASARHSHPPPRISPEALELMRTYRWPGNVRELKNMIERAVLLSAGAPICPEHLALEKMRAIRATGPALMASEDLPSVPVSPPPRRGSAEELASIVQALERAGGNQTVAAKLLGISRRTLVNRLNDYKHLDRPRKHKPTRPREA